MYIYIYRYINKKKCICPVVKSIPLAPTGSPRKSPPPPAFPPPPKTGPGPHPWPGPEPDPRSPWRPTGANTPEPPLQRRLAGRAGGSGFEALRRMPLRREAMVAFLRAAWAEHLTETYSCLPRLMEVHRCCRERNHRTELPMIGVNCTGNRSVSACCQLESTNPVRGRTFHSFAQRPSGHEGKPWQMVSIGQTSWFPLLMGLFKLSICCFLKTTKVRRKKVGDVSYTPSD